MKVLIVGSGGREHALAWKLAESPRVSKLYCAPGNAGITGMAELVNIKPSDIHGLLRFAVENGVDFTVVGMEDPLALGIVDLFEENGKKIFGPSKAAARLEGSKVFAKHLMKKYGIPTAAYEAFDNYADARAYLLTCAYPCVIKADGLAAGKGVIICGTYTEALAALEQTMVNKSFGAAGERVVVEEFLRGREVSVLAFCDGKTVVPMESARDYKRAQDGDAGPNTGGMGCVSPCEYYTKDMQEYCMERVFKPTLKAMEAEGAPYKGVLYFGLMVSDEGVKVLEYNARFGDPETQVVLPRMKTDLLEALLACADGTLDRVSVEWASEAAVCVILASGGYPGKYETGYPITGLHDAVFRENTVVFHAGTAFADGAVCTSGGRVLGVTGLGADCAAAAETAYGGLRCLSFENMQFRTDIGQVAGGASPYPVRRLFVEKKKGFDVEAELMLRDLKENFSLDTRYVRLINRYDVAGMPEELYQRAKTLIFSEPAVDAVYEEEFPVEAGDVMFAVEYLPGQYNQRADSAEQCVRLISAHEGAVVASAKVYVLGGALSPGDIDAVKRYCVNPVDSREASAVKPERLEMETAAPAPVEILAGFTEKTAAELVALREKLGLAMSAADLGCVQAYFREERREPTMTELRCLDTYWSDHCRHTTFHAGIRRVEIEDGAFAAPIREAHENYLAERKALGRDAGEVCLMDIAVTGMKALKARGLLDDLDESDEINACSIKVDVDVDGRTEPWLVMFKNETHNHPTEIEPFGGAATCLGGAIRDPLSGRAFVYQAVRVTGSGDPRASVAETLPGKLPQRRITTEAARGFSSYGNQIGLATGHVAEVYHEGFVAKRMEIGAVVGAAPAANVRREAPAPGDMVVLVGGRTGRDGCGGATGSSKEHTEESILLCGAEVQKGNPITERKIQRLFRNPRASRLIKRCNDFGAGGVCVAVGELAAGLTVNLDLVPKKYEGLDGTELAISESQERMAVVVAESDAEAFMGLCAEENLEATVIAEVTEERRLRMFWRGAKIVDLNRDFLDTNGARQEAAVRVAAPVNADYFAANTEAAGESGMKQAWLNNLRGLNACSRKGLVERFDSSIGAGTVLMPFGGETGLTPAEAAVAKLPVRAGETNAATIMAHGYDPLLSSWSPFHGAVYAVVEALAKVTACGGDFRKARLSFQEYFEKLGDNDEKWGKPFAGLLGALHAQLSLGVPAIGGKDSMSGTFRDIHVPPVVAAFALCVADAGHVISPEFKRAGSRVAYVPLPRDTRAMPDFAALRNIYAAVHGLICRGKILAAHTVRGHGVSEALAKMCFGNSIGVIFDAGFDDQALFAPGYGSLILEIPAEEDPSALLAGVPFLPLGETVVQPAITIGSVTMPLAELAEVWQGTLERVFPSKAPMVSGGSPIDAERPATHGTAARVKHARPRVFLPVFPGTNCEDDSAAAFRRAGADVAEFVFKNLTGDDVAQSIEHIKAGIKSCQILMLPGGFSAGDEPDGSAKFITAVFRNPFVSEAVAELLANRDGLVLGICNGFQALLKLGLLEHGAIAPVDEHSPTLSYNSIGRHISLMARTRVVCGRSPWLAGVSPGDEYVLPLSHGEGRFMADERVMAKLLENRQIATVYAGENPNGSVGGVEGVTSPCGRVFGKMAHSERIGANLYKNIAGHKDQKLFESGVKYYF